MTIAEANKILENARGHADQGKGEKTAHQQVQERIACAVLQIAEEKEQRKFARGRQAMFAKAARAAKQRKAAAQ